MNIIAIDIGNTNIKIGLYLDGEEQPIQSIPGDNKDKISSVLCEMWDQIPIMKRSKEHKRDGVIALCSVKPEWTEMIKDICTEELSEKALEIGFDKDIPVPIKLDVEYPANVGVDRAIAAAAAYFVVEDAVIVADFGTAVTIDVVDEKGNFMGGMIAPGFDISMKALKSMTAKLPEVEIKTPKVTFGTNTNDAIMCGLYYSAVGLLEVAARKLSEEIGKWPQTIVTGRNAAIIKKDCDFIDSWVDNLVVKGIVLSYKKYMEEKALD